MADFKVRFSLEGGNEITSGSGREIHNQLKEIAKKISKAKELKVGFILDDKTDYTKIATNIEKKLKTENIKLRFGVDTAYLNEQLKSYYKTYQAPSKAVGVPNTWGKSAKQEMREIMKLNTALKSGSHSSEEKKAMAEELSLRRQRFDAIMKEIKGIEDETQKLRILMDLEKEALILQSKENTKKAKNYGASGKKLLTDANRELLQIERLKNKQAIASSQEAKSFIKDEIDIHQEKLKSIEKEIKLIKNKTIANRLLLELEELKKDSEMRGNSSHALIAERDAALYTDLYKDAANYMRQYGDAIKHHNPAAHAQLAKFIDEFRDADFEGGPRAGEEAFKKFQATMSATGATVDTFGMKLKKIFGEKFMYGVLATAALMARRLFGQMFNEVKNIDAAMTELRKVTDEVDASYERFLTRAASRAKELGAAVSDVVTATADFARLGYSIEDASSLADAAIVYKNVGDGISDISSASESIISAVQAFKEFGVTADDAMLIVDKFNEVGNNFAISSKGVGDGLSKSAAALASANNSLDESIALITAANTTVQNPDSVGTSLKTVSMYLRAAKTEAEEAGESTDGMASSVSELRKELLSLTGNKVDIMVDDRNFKSTYQILKELSLVWDNLADISQANILEMIGGKRNSNVISALLSNFDIAEEVMKASSDAAGSALAENEEYLNSINGKIAILSANFQEFSSNFLSSGLVKFVIDFGSGLVSVVNALQEIKVLTPSLVALFTIPKALKGAKSIDFVLTEATTNGATDLLTESYIKLDIMQQKYAANQIKRLIIDGKVSAETGEQILKNLGLAESLDEVTESSERSKISMGSMIGGGHFGWIALATAVVFSIVQIVKKLHKTAEELRDEYDENTSKLTDLNSELETSKKRYQELLSLSNSGSITLIEQEELERLKITNEELERSIRLQEQLADREAKKVNDRLTKDFGKDSFLLGAIPGIMSAPGQMDGGSQNSGWIANLTSFDDQLVVIIKRYKELRAIGTGMTDGQLLEFNTIEQRLLDIASHIQTNYVDLYVGSGAELDVWNGYLNQIDACINAGEYFSDLLLELPLSLQRVLNSEGSNGTLTATRINELATKYEDTLGKWMEESRYTAEEIAAHFNSLYAPLIDNKATIAGLVNEYSHIFKNLSTMPQATIDSAMKKISREISELPYDPSYWKDIDIPNALSAYDGYSDAFAQIVEAERTMTEEGDVSIETLKALSDAGVDYMNALEIQGDKLLLNTEKLKDNTKAKIQNQIATLKLTLQKLYSDRDIASGIIDPSSHDEIAYATITQSIANITGQIDLWEALLGDMADASHGADALAAALRASKSEMDQLDQVMKQAQMGGFESLIVDDFSVLLELMPELRGEMVAFLEASKAGTATQDAWNELFKKITKGARNVKSTHVADIMKDIVDAVDTYGGESYQVEMAMAQLAQHCPTLVSQIYDVENGINMLGNSAASAKAALLGLGGVNLEVDFEASEAKLTDLNTKISSTGAKLADLSKRGNMSGSPLASQYYSLIEQRDFLKEQMDEMSLMAEASLVFKANDAGGGGGGGSSETIADKIKDSFDALASSIEISIQKEEEYFENGKKNLDSNVMRDALMQQVAYYQQVQREAASALEAVKDYYRDQGLSEGAIEQQSQVQDLTNDYLDATKNVKDAVDRMTSAIIDAFGEAIDSMQSVYDTLHKAADEYASSGYITVDILQEIISHGVEYLSLLQDENGQLVINEDNIKKIIAARVEQMSVETALAYVEALHAAKTAGNTAELNRLLYTTQEVTGAQWDLVYATLALSDLDEEQNSAALHVIDNLRAMSENAQRGIYEAADSATDALKQTRDELEKMKSGVDDILEHTMSMIEHEIEKQIEAIEDQKDAFAEYIEMQKEALDNAKDEADYEEKKADILKKLATLQGNIDSLSLVGTREAEAEKATLLEEQAELQKELAELQGDHAIEVQKEALDKMQESFEKEKDEEIKATEESISSQQKLYDMAIDYIENNWDTLYDSLINWNYEYGSVLEDEIISAWDNAMDAAEKYGDYLKALRNLQSDIDDIDGQINSSSSSGGSNSNTGLVETPSYDHSSSDEAHIRAIVQRMKTNSQTWHTASAERQAELSAETYRLGTQELSKYGVKAVRGDDGVWYIDYVGGEQLYKKYGVYHTGGIVGGGDVKSNEQFALLEKREWVLNENMVDNLTHQMSLMGKLGDFASKLFNMSGVSIGNKIADLFTNNSHRLLSATNSRPIEISIGDTYISGMPNDTVKQHQAISKKFMDDLARQLGARW